MQGSRKRSSTQPLSEGAEHWKSCAKGNSEIHKLTRVLKELFYSEDTEFCRLLQLWAIHQCHLNLRTRKKGRGKKSLFFCLQSLFLFAVSQCIPKGGRAIKYPSDRPSSPGMFVQESGETQHLPWCLAGSPGCLERGFSVTLFPLKL